MIFPSEDRLVEKVESRYTLVVLASKRAKQLRDGAPKLIETTSTNPLTIALEEIAAGAVTYRVLDHDELPGRPAEPELEAAQVVEEAQLEAAELVVEEKIDEAARVAQLLEIPESEKAEQPEEPAPVDAAAVAQLLEIPEDEAIEDVEEVEAAAPAEEEKPKKRTYKKKAAAEEPEAESAE